MFATKQALRLYDYDLAVLKSAGVRERYLEDRGADFPRWKAQRRDGILKVKLRELLKPGVFEQICAISWENGPRGNSERQKQAGTIHEYGNW